MDNSATKPKMTIGMLGGKMGPIVDEAAVIATLKSSSYPPSRMASSSIWPKPAASTTAAPDMPEKIRLATVLACPRPPGKNPTRARAKLKIR